MRTKLWKGGKLNSTTLIIVQSMAFNNLQSATCFKVAIQLSKLNQKRTIDSISENGYDTSNF